MDVEIIIWKKLWSQQIIIWKNYDVNRIIWNKFFFVRGPICHREGYYWENGVLDINVFRSVRLFEIFRSETCAEAPQDKSFLGFNGRLLAEILSVLPRVLRMSRLRAFWGAILLRILAENLQKYRHYFWQFRHYF